jgi:hypothetical protein
VPIARLWIGDGSAAKIDGMNFEELDYRENDAIQVSLLWNRSDDSLTVRVHDARTEDTFDVRVQAHEAMDAFCHPFAYAARRDAEDQRDQSGFFFSRNALRPS